MADWVEVFTASNLPHAYVIKNALAAHGIEASVGNEHLQGALGDLPPGLMTAPRILVEASHAEKARAIIEEAERRISEIPAEEEQESED